MQDRKETLLPELSELITRHTGLRFNAERRPDLARGLQAAARELGFNDVATCALWMLSSPLTEQHVAILASHLTVGETYFFRDRPAFQALRERILPELIKRKRGNGQELRVWSAGCASGEEVYSLAILLSQLIPDIDDWLITLLATDINAQALRKATAGVYGRWSFRDNLALSGTPYFAPTNDGRFRLRERYRRMVKFQWLNLVDANYPSTTNGIHSMDLVVCRNVLMYLTRQATAEVLRKLHVSLADDGWLWLAPSEAPDGVLNGFATVTLPGCILFKKSPDTVDSAGPILLPTGNGDLFGSAFPTEVSTIVPQFVASTAMPRSCAAAETTPEISPSSLPAETAGAPGGGAIPAAIAKAIGDETQDAAQAVGIATFDEMARSYANEGRLDEAATWCDKALRMDKMNPAHSFLFASIREEQGRFDDAERLLRRTLYLDPDFVLAHVALGHLAKRRGASSISRRHFGNALELLKRFPPGDKVPQSDGITAGRLAEIVADITAG